MPLLLEARVRRSNILAGAFQDAEREARMLTDYLGDRTIDTLADIGCGHAFVDLPLYRKYQSDVWLIDIERTEDKHHNFHDTGSGYSSLSGAKQFLTGNGVPTDKVFTCNPRQMALPAGPFDAIISLISAGFHYPIEEYATYGLKALKPGGVLIFDMRLGSDQDKFLEGYSKIEQIDRQVKHVRIAATK